MNRFACFSICCVYADDLGFIHPKLVLDTSLPDAFSSCWTTLSGSPHALRLNAIIDPFCIRVTQTTQMDQPVVRKTEIAGTQGQEEGFQHW